MEMLSRLDYYAIGRRYMLTRARRIEPTIVDTEGSDANLFVGSTSFAAAAVTRQLATRIAALLLGSCEDEDLDRYAWDRYQETRKGASAAVGEVYFTRPATSTTVGTIRAGTVLLSLGSIEYVTTEDASFGATTTSVGPIAVRATQAGKQAQVGRNQLRRFRTAVFDSTIAVNNVDPTAGGEPREQDDDFRERVRDFWRSARRGTLGAIELGARTVPGIVSAQAVEALDGDGRPARVVNLYVADSSGVASATLGRQVDTRLLDYRAAGIAVITSTSIPQITAVVLRLVFEAGIATGELAGRVKSAVFEYVNSLPVNGKLTRAGLLSILQRFRGSGLDVDESTLVEPAGDVVPSPGRTIRTTLANITFL